MDGKRWIPNGMQLEIERLPEMELQKKHLSFISACMKYDLWKDISDTYEFKMREMLGNELRTRMSAI